ncbi:PREDICTED: histone chaperone ASF1-like [Fragaria vesca subsp. vesca]|uniref:histone chaperone ASF1-like n=1 Tax=Fragaria vesca subsp. vesca TaxID=101020 RepID=UPI0002C2E176|nr:PREDICTED: histone chaperone ASF1-like [Fragaria vesca subsp. vesca]
MALRSLTLPLPAVIPPTSSRRSTLTQNRCYVTLRRTPTAVVHSLRMRRHVVRMAPEEERLTRRSPLDFPIEWERPKPGRRPDIFPQFSPMKTPLPTPMPADPPEEDEEEDEKKEDDEEGEDNPDKENPGIPEE